jgi:hypothetical protein
MKTWTVVIEVRDYGEVIDNVVTDNYLSEYGIKELLAIRDCPNHISYSICETIPAPYGPQHPDGVWISEHNKLSNAPQRLYQPKVKP